MTTRKLSTEERHALEQLADKVGAERLAAELGVGESTLVRGMAGLPVRPSSATAIGFRLRELAPGTALLSATAGNR